MDPNLLLYGLLDSALQVSPVELESIIDNIKTTISKIMLIEIHTPSSCKCEAGPIPESIKILGVVMVPALIITSFLA